MQVNMLDAKSQLSKLVKAALAGEDVIIANKGTPAVRLVPVSAPPPSRKPGAWAHLNMTEAQITDAFSAATDAAITRLFDVESPHLSAATIRAGGKRKLADKVSRTRNKK